MISPTGSLSSGMDHSSSDPRQSHHNKARPPDEPEKSPKSVAAYYRIVGTPNFNRSLCTNELQNSAFPYAVTISNGGNWILLWAWNLERKRLIAPVFRRGRAGEHFGPTWCWHMAW